MFWASIYLPPHPLSTLADWEMQSDPPNFHSARRFPPFFPFLLFSGVAHQYLLSPPTAHSAHNVRTRLAGVPAIPSLASLIAETELALADTRLILNRSSAPGGGGNPSGPTAPHSQDACGDKTGWKDDVTFGGRAIGLKFTATSAECCAEANRAPYTYYPDIGACLSLSDGLSDPKSAVLGL